MARKRTPDLRIVRDRLAETRTALVAMYPELARHSPWLDDLHKLRSGQPVEVSAWEVASYLPLPVYEYDADMRLRVESDGRLTLL